eukprot:scaffold22728_cov55-Attheya_sp.AAC.2
MQLFPFRVRSQSVSSVVSPPAKQSYRFIEDGAASDDNIDRKRSRRGSDSSACAMENLGKRSRFFSFSKRGERKDETPHQDTSIHSKKGGAKNSSARESRDEHEEAYESDLASGIQSSRDEDETLEDDDDVSHDALKSFEKGYEGKKREEFCIRQIKIPTSRSTFQPIKMPSPLVTNTINNNNNWGLASAFIVVPDENTPQGALNQPDTYPTIGIEKNMVNSGSPLLNQGGYQVVPVSPPPPAK